MKAAVKKAVKAIQDAGFSHIKLELEGTLQRDRRMSCVTCQGNGRSACSTCDGSGAVVREANERFPESTYAECPNCFGDGVSTCSPCSGRGHMGDWSSVDDCDRFMKQFVSDEARAALTYGRFYYDGSVDSEFTFTLPIDKVEYAIEYINAFKELGKRCGNGKPEVSGAGLHTAVLVTQSNGSYPYSYRWPEAKLNNFQTQMRKLLPALFFLASCDGKSRGLRYRPPQVERSKYSAINITNGAIEYRVFETCYDHPERFLDYVQVIAKSLAFYANSRLTVPSLNKQFSFIEGKGVSRFYTKVEHLRILNAQIKYLKPEDKSFKELRAERGMRNTISSLVKAEAASNAGLKQEYKKYNEYIDEQVKRPLSPREQRDVDWYVLEDGYSMEEAIHAVRGTPRKVSFDDYVRTHSRNSERQGTLITV